MHGALDVVTVQAGPDGIRVDADAYRLRFRPDRPYADLLDVGGDAWASLLTASSIATSADLDDTTAMQLPHAVDGPDGPEIVVEASSSAWARRRTVFTAAPDHLEIRTEVEGEGSLGDVHLLGGYVSAWPRWGSGFLASGMGFRSMVTPDPSSPERDVTPSAEPATVDVLGGGLPGRGRWFFTPGPLCFAVHRETVASPAASGPWSSVGVGAPLERLTFSGLHHEPGERSFALRLAYEGMTRVAGAWTSPSVLVTFGGADAYGAVRDHVRLLARRGWAARPARQVEDAPGWWRQPIFCGWGAQYHVAEQAGGRPADWSRQAVYDGFLRDLARRGVDPGTVVVDDRWERVYGSGEADAGAWPDLRGWIAARHGEGRRVLLWWKAWAPDALDAALCVRNAGGLPVAADPSNPAYLEVLQSALERMLGPDGYDADGLKVDFTARTPSGPGMGREGSAWGIALLHGLLAALHHGAKRVKPDALVMTQSPHPAFADVTDMLRLNDVQRLDDPSPGAPFVEHMVHRGRLVAAAMPGMLIDTDNWALPDRASWRAYLDRQPELGVPSLYYTTHIDRSGEPLLDEDYAALRRVWANYRRSAGLPAPGREPA